MTEPVAPWRPDIAAMLELGRALDRAAAAGEPSDQPLAAAVVADLARYVDSLPPAQRAATTHRLVAALLESAPSSRGLA